MPFIQLEKRDCLVTSLPAVMLLFFFLILAAGCFTEAQARTSTDGRVLEKRYHLAKFYYHNLQAGKNMGRARENWENGIRVFRQIYLANPKHEAAESSLFMMGRMYHEMYSRFNNPLDLGEAVTYYQDVAFLSPTSSLADDALYLLGRVYLTDKNDRNRAVETFSIITRQYPDGDMFRAAVTELRNLQENGPGAAVEVVKQNGFLAQILPIRYWSSNNYTRIVIKSTAQVSFKDELLDKTGSQPRRLYFDFASSRIGPKASEPIPIQDGLLRQVRAGQYKPDTVRVVLDLESISKYKVFTLQDPFRIVVDVMGQQENGGEDIPVLAAGKEKVRLHDEPALARQTPVPGVVKKIPAPPPLARKAQPASKHPLSLAQQLGLGIRRIVIDPGHGGRDPGAIAENGLKEKDIVLKIARSLSDKLRGQLAVNVILTRDSDVFIPLEERTAIANTSKGDLFISLHVNSAPQPSVLGVETYTLNLTNDEKAMQLAAFENATSTSKMSDLEDILSEILNYTKIDESTKLAKHMQSSMTSGLNLRDLGVKQAPFYVLIGAQMPAVLTEVTFLSNPDEARRLQKSSYLETIADQIVAGIGDYVKSENIAMVRD